MGITKLILNIYNMWNKPRLGKSGHLEVEFFQDTVTLLHDNRSILPPQSLHSPFIKCFIVANLSFFPYVT